MKPPDWLTALINILTTLLLLQGAMYFTLFGWPVPLTHIEMLHWPVDVVGWSPDGLMLANGRRVMPKGMRRLPVRSAGLTAAIRRDVEVHPDGRVVGLVRIWHWCGNDALQNDVRRIDLAHLLAYLREGEPISPFGTDESKPYKPGGAFGRSGWNVSEYAGLKKVLRDRGLSVKPPLAP
jgi:hypothetical protein